MLPRPSPPSPLVAYLGSVLSAPLCLPPTLHPDTHIAWPLEPPSLSLRRLVDPLHGWLMAREALGCGYDRDPPSTGELLACLVRTPTSVLTPLYHALAQALWPSLPSAATAYPRQTPLRHRFAALGDASGVAGPQVLMAPPALPQSNVRRWATVPHADHVSVHVPVANASSTRTTATVVAVARDAASSEAALSSLLARPSLRQRLARHVSTAVRSLEQRWTGLTHRPQLTASTAAVAAVPPPSPIPLARVLPRVSMRALTSRTHPVVLHWTRAHGTVPEEVRLIRYAAGAIDTQGRPTECRIRRLAKTGSSAYKSVDVATLAFPVGTAPPVMDHAGAAATAAVPCPPATIPLAVTQQARGGGAPRGTHHGILSTHWPTDTTPIVPPPRADVTPALAALVDLPMRTDAPLRTPHHVGRLYVQMGTTDVAPVGVYTESRLDDGTTLRLYTFEREPHKVYTHRSRRRTDGVRV